MDSTPPFKGTPPCPVRPSTPEESPDGNPRWLITRHDDVISALSSPKLVMKGRRPDEIADCSFARLVDEQRGPSAPEETATQVLRDAFFVFEPPIHPKLRKLVVRFFSAKRLEAMRPRVQEIADELLDSLSGRQHVDLMKAYAFPLPVRVLSELLEIPEFIQKRLLPPEDEITTPVIPFETVRPVGAELLEHRRRKRGKDMISALVDAQERGEITEAEILALPLILLIAGYLTTVHLIGNGVLMLLRHPEQLAELRRDPSLMPSAVDEVLRYVGSVSSVSRFAGEDVEFGDATIPAGSHVRVLMNSANRDAGVFADPDSFDIHRGEHGLAFGYGDHYCLGAHLAKVEGEVGIGSLIRRYPDLALTDESVAVTEIEDGVIGLRNLPVRLWKDDHAVH